MCWSSGMADGPTCRASCPSRSLSLVCKIPGLLIVFLKTNTIDSTCDACTRLGQMTRIASLAGPMMPHDEERTTDDALPRAVPYPHHAECLCHACPAWRPGLPAVPRHAALGHHLRPRPVCRPELGAADHQHPRHRPYLHGE